MPGIAKSPVQYFVLWAAALIWLFPGHLSLLPASIKFDPISIVVVLALGTLCLGTRWRGANDPRLMFAMLALLMATAVSFMGYLIKPAQGLNAFYRPVGVADGDAVTRLEPSLNVGADSRIGVGTMDSAGSVASRINAKLMQFTRTSLPYAGAVNASWEGFITVPAGVSRIELAHQGGSVQLSIDNADIAGNAFTFERKGIYKVAVRFASSQQVFSQQDFAQLATHQVALRWTMNGVTETVSSEFLSPQRPNVVASDIGFVLQWTAFGVWLAALGWALRVARPRWNGHPWLASGELAMLMLLPQRALARGGYKI